MVFLSGLKRLKFKCVFVAKTGLFLQIPTIFQRLKTVKMYVENS